MAPLSNLCKKVFLNGIVQRNGLLRFRLVSTSGKKEEAANKTGDAQNSVNRKAPDFSKPLENKNWVSYGFHPTDENIDNSRLHLSYFMCLSVLLCGGIFIFAYFPDRKRDDWARREAFIRLHEREQLGLEPIDANYIDPSKIVLPPDEELEEENIVI